MVPAIIRAGVTRFRSALQGYTAKDKIATGELIHLLPDHHFPRQGIYAPYPDTRHVPEKVRAFIDFLHYRLALGSRSFSLQAVNARLR